MPQKPTRIYHSFSSAETRNLGAELISEVLRTIKLQGTRKPEKRAGALVLALKGSLGAGKTTFVQGLFRGLRLNKRALSPTFVLMRRYALRGRKRFAAVFHVDAYRLKRGRDLGSLGFDELLADPRNMVFLEWADRVREILPKNAWLLQFRHGQRENERHIMIKQPRTPI